ncbi:potassium-transporting ATPase subunit KdpC [Cellulosimicrobium protaetiae]|uniref:potassium-transporting ATPase subunit KdpC n=1 Tax=Cellulosimicrobium protaetiae TaxID=2587808 RepID=UPI0012B9BC78|nr:potassium-transporting ATPase subunit KdpC [Cellulosimicrobium protaetiae]
MRVLLLLTVLLGGLYPLAVTGVGQAVFGWQANGSLVRADGTRASSVDDTGADGAPVVGSVLVGQSFGEPGTAPEWFHGRPSAAGEGYDTLASAGSNLGPNNPDLVAAIEERRAAVAAEDGVDPATVPPDAVTASASGLDPHVSPAYAYQQVDRVAAVRGLDPAAVRTLVDDAVAGRVLGVLGDERVNVLALNLALDDLAPAGTASEGSGAS